MAELDLTQEEADALIAMEKCSTDHHQWTFPASGGRLSIPLVSKDKREKFMLDVTRSQVKLTKATYQTRARQVIILMRLDLDGPAHRNPDNTEVPCPHLHVYREGFGDKWAHAAPKHLYPNAKDLVATFEVFMQQCNITELPSFQMELF